MSIIRRRQHEVPGLNTSSLPDLIFTVLFFFMIVTHMQTDIVKVRYQVPQGTELTRVVKKSAVTYIYIGKLVDGRGSGYSIQVNDRLVSVDRLADCIREERRRMAPDDLSRHTVSIKADRHTPMYVIKEVKDALRKAHALKICYTASDKTP